MPKNWKIFLSAAVLVCVSAFSFYAGRQSAPAMIVKLDNSRVTVSQSTTPAGGRRESYVRGSDQLLVFLDEAQYEALEADGKATLRHRESGEIVWHTKGEVAPALVNRGKPYRNLVIAFK